MGNTVRVHYTNIRALSDGAFLGHAKSRYISVPVGIGTYEPILKSIQKEGFDCNGVEYEFTIEPVKTGRYVV